MGGELIPPAEVDAAAAALGIVAGGLGWPFHTQAAIQLQGALSGQLACMDGGSADQAWKPPASWASMRARVAAPSHASVEPAGWHPPSCLGPAPCPCPCPVSLPRAGISSHGILRTMCGAVRAGTVCGEGGEALLRTLFEVARRCRAHAQLGPLSLEPLLALSALGEAGSLPACHVCAGGECGVGASAAGCHRACTRQLRFPLRGDSTTHALLSWHVRQSS